MELKNIERTGSSHSGSARGIQAPPVGPKTKQRMRYTVAYALRVLAQELALADGFSYLYGWLWRERVAKWTGG